MTELKPPHLQLITEESSLTGGRSVSEIVQILRSKAKLNLKVKDFDEIEEVEEQPNKNNQLFPWLKKITVESKDLIGDPDIKKLDVLITSFLKHIEDSAKECYKKPKRAFKLRMRMNSFLQLFNMIYTDLQKPLQHASYLNRMSEIMALYIDIELESSRRGREHPKKISERICTSLIVFLDNSIDHILDAVLQAKYFIKKYSEICCPILARLLKDNPGVKCPNTYVRFLLSFKLWKKLAGKDHYVAINKEAVAKLKPPKEFPDTLKSGVYSNVLPYVSRSDKNRMTHFFMQSPFNVKKKAQVFLKDEKKMQANLELEGSLLLDDDSPISSFFDDDNSVDLPDVMMNDIWKNLVDQEDNCLDDLFVSMDIVDSNDDEENIIVVEKKKTKVNCKKIAKNKATNGILKTSLKKRKSIKVNLKNVINQDVVIDLVRSDMSRQEATLALCVKTEDTLSSLTNNPEIKPTKKPCATVEPDQCKEVTESVMEVSANPETSSKESSVESTPTTTTAIDSFPSSEDNVISDSKDLFADSGFKIVKPYDQRILEENFIAEEVEISSDTPCTYMFLDGDNKIDQNDIMNVIGIATESPGFCSNEVVINSVLLTKEQENQQGVGINSLPVNSSNSSNSLKQDKIKCHTSFSPENQFLPSTIVSTENENCISLYPRQDSYTCNDMFLTSFLSETTPVDEGSDDDNRYHNESRFAGGGKLPAFRQHLEESKSDVGDDFDPLSPSTPSNSQEQSLMESSPEAINSQPPPVELSPRGSDHEMKIPVTPVRVDISLQSHSPDDQKSLPQDEAQLKELSIDLSHGLNVANQYLADKDKLNPKGTFNTPLDRNLHYQTVSNDYNFSNYQEYLYNLYNATPNILSTDPVPPPSRSQPYCECHECNNHLAYLYKNYSVLFKIRCRRICLAIDQEKYLSRLYVTANRSKVEQELLELMENRNLMAAVDNLHAERGTGSNDHNKTVENSLMAKEMPETMGKPTPEPEEKLEKNENKNNYSSLPPKKRKAFNVGSDSVSTESQSEETMSVGDGREEQCTQSLIQSCLRSDNTIDKCKNTAKECYGCSPVKITSVDGCYRVMNEEPRPSDLSEPSVENDLGEHVSKSEKKSRCKHKRRTKEEKRLRKEEKRLKKLKKQEERSNKN